MPKALSLVNQKSSQEPPSNLGGHLMSPHTLTSSEQLFRDEMKSGL